MAKITKTICIDFDGVIHRYSLGYHDGSTYDVPVEGAFPAIKKLLESYCVVILSTRKPETIKEWLEKYARDAYSFEYEVIPDDDSFEWTKRNVVGITNRKLKAMIYIDDRGLRFTNWKDMLNYVR